MAEDWLIDVRRYVADADDKVVGAIVRYCGIALQNRDSSLVSFSDVKETDRVRQNYLRKKLGLTHDDAALNAGIAAVSERMKADSTRNRVTVYYLLADHFDGLAIFGGTPRGGAGGAALAGGALGLAAAAPAASASRMTSPNGGGAVPPRSGYWASRGDDDGYLGWGCGFGLLLLGGIILAALLAWAADRRTAAPAAAPVAAVAAPAPVVESAPATQTAPKGAGVIASERDAKPMLTVYFDTGKADVTPDFTAAAAPVLAYLEANPGASLAISGFNDPTGNAAANAELSKNRAQNVKAALEGLGVDADKAALEKPAETTGTGATNTESRRVEVVVKE